MAIGTGVNRSTHSATAGASPSFSASAVSRMADNTNDKKNNNTHSSTQCWGSAVTPSVLRIAMRAVDLCVGGRVRAGGVAHAEGVVEDEESKGCHEAAGQRAE